MTSQMICPENEKTLSPPGRRVRFRHCGFLIVLCVMVLAGFLVIRTQSLQNWMAPKTFWRKDHNAIAQYHIRDYRVPWSEQLLAGIVFARMHGEHLYLEDTPAETYARNQGNVKPVNISESELVTLRRVSDFLAEHCAPDVQRTFPTDAVATEAKRLFDDVLAEHPQLFYVHYLLGVWYREHGGDSANACFDKAFDIADCVILCPVMLLNDHSGKVVPVKDTRFPFGVTTKHRTEQWGDVTLWYPVVTTDQHGLVRLPVYREMIADPALEAVDSDGTRLIVETFGLRDIAKPYRFGLYEPIVLSGELHSRLTCPPGLEEELRYAKRQVFANLSLDDAKTLGELEITFENPNQLLVGEGGIIMPAVRYANEFAGLHFRGLTRTELARQLQQYRDEHDREQTQCLTVADGDNFIVSRHNGRTYLCRFFANNDPQQPGVLDIWDLGWVAK